MIWGNVLKYLHIFLTISTHLGDLLSKHVFATFLFWGGFFPTPGFLDRIIHIQDGLLLIFITASKYYNYVLGMGDCLPKVSLALLDLNQRLLLVLGMTSNS